MGGKAELQQLRSILSLSYGPLGAYVDPTTGAYRISAVCCCSRHSILKYVAIAICNRANHSGDGKAATVSCMERLAPCKRTP